MFAVYLFLLLFTTTAVNSIRWGSFQRDRCTYNCKRQYSSVLKDIPRGTDGNTACKNTPANINGNLFSGANRCTVSWWRQWGQFDVRDDSCCPYWGSFQKDRCTSNCQRQFSAILWNIQSGENWDTSCKNTQANVNGVQFSGAKRCPQAGGHQWGEFDVRDDSCCPYWGSFKLDKCSNKSGKAIYSAVLYDIPRLETWESSCTNFGAYIGGQFFNKPIECVNTGLNMWGKFEVTYAESIASSSTKCYSFEWEDSNSPTDCVSRHDELRRKRSNYQCNYVGLPRGIYMDGPIPDLSTLLARNSWAQSESSMSQPQPPTINNYPQLSPETEVPNTFAFNYRYTYRMLRSTAQEDYIASMNPNHENRVDEGDGLNGVFPRYQGPNPATIYQHVVQDDTNSPYISTTNDFGRTRALAIEQALTAFNYEFTRYEAGRSRYFVQIDLTRGQSRSNLSYHDLTNPAVLNSVGVDSTGNLALSIVRYARRWSEVLVQGAIPSTNIVASFQVTAINTTHYFLIVHRNPNYQP